MKKILAYMAVLILGASAAFGQMPTWRVKDVENDKYEASSGLHFEILTTFAHRGPSFAGKIEEAYEVTDGSGARTFYAYSYPSGGAKSMNTEEYGGRTFLFVGDMAKPVLTGYAIRLTITGAQGIADEKAYKCASMAELIQRNATSRKVEASNSTKPLFSAADAR